MHLLRFLSVTMLLAACGQAGDLYLPDKSPATTPQPATAPTAPPAADSTSAFPEPAPNPPDPDEVQDAVPAPSTGVPTVIPP